MHDDGFVVGIEGRQVRVDPKSQHVTVTDEAGRVVYSGGIQVAAGSVQGLFSMIDDAASMAQPLNRA